jgi:hypothetical protein
MKRPDMEAHTREDRGRALGAGYLESGNGIPEYLEFGNGIPEYLESGNGIPEYLEFGNGIPEYLEFGNGMSTQCFPRSISACWRTSLSLAPLP